MMDFHLREAWPVVPRYFSITVSTPVINSAVSKSVIDTLEVTVLTVNIIGL